MTIRSHVLHLGTHASTAPVGWSSASGLVPVGEVWIVKQLVIQNSGSLTDVFAVQVVRPGVVTVVIDFGTITVAQLFRHQERLFHILEPGDYIQVLTGAGQAAAWWISGAKLA
jgi:hypothetical protein